jgi:LysM repeat protein
MIERTSKVTKNLKILPILVAVALVVLLNSVAFAAPPLQTGDQQDGVQQDDNQDSNQDDGDNTAQDDLQPQSQFQQDDQKLEAQPGATQQGQQGTAQQGNLQATGGCAQQYTVQAGDSLSSLANQFFGDPQSYNLILDSTNNAGANNGFATIADPNIIQVGQTLCIPAQADQQASTQQQGQFQQSGQQAGMQQQGQLQQSGQQAGMQQQGQLQQSGQQGTMANQNMLSVPEGLSKIVFQNLSSRDLIVDVSNGPTPQSVWVNPGTQHEFVVQPGQYTVMGHQPGVEFAIASRELQLQDGQLVGVTCQDTSQCQLFSTSQELAMLDQGTVPLNPNPLLSPVPQVEDDEDDDEDDSPHTRNNDD